MKKKIYFIIMGIIEILTSIYSIVFVNKVLEANQSEIKETLNSFNSGITEKYTGLLESANSISIIIMAIICILLSIIVLNIVLRDTIYENRSGLIGIMGGLYLTSINKYAGLLAVIGFIIALSIPKEKNIIKEKKLIPTLEKHKTSIRDILLGVLFVLFYLSDYLWADYVPRRLLIPVVVIFELLLVVFCVLIYYKDLKRDIIAFKNNFKVYFKYALKTWGLMLLTVIICALFLSMFGKIDESTNQQLLKKLPLLYVIPSAVIMAPIVEETIFRGVLRKVIRNDLIFIIISGIAFGSLHVLKEPSILAAIKASVTYIVMGMFMARCYVKTNNITINMLIHLMQNTMASIFTFLI